MVKKSKTKIKKTSHSVGRKKSDFKFLSIPFLSGMLVVVVIVAALYLNIK